jgi:hypothetical protein
MLMIHRPSNTVIAKFSTWPDRMDYELADLTDAADARTVQLAVVIRPGDCRSVGASAIMVPSGHRRPDNAST